jgi:hypothetical protein
MSLNVEMNGTPNAGPIPPQPRHERKKWLLGLPLILGFFFISTISFLEGERAVILPDTVSSKNESTSELHVTFIEAEDSTKAAAEKKAKEEADEKAKQEAEEKARKEKVFEKLLDVEDMLESFEAKRQELYKKLEQDYGPAVFKKMFLDNGRSKINPPTNSKDKESTGTGRMVRKMMLKILKGQAAAKSLTSNNITSHENRRMEDADLAGFPTYVWATGGHRYVVFWNQRTPRRPQSRCLSSPHTHSPFISLLHK